MRQFRLHANKRNDPVDPGSPVLLIILCCVVLFASCTSDVPMLIEHSGETSKNDSSVFAYPSIIPLPQSVTVTGESYIFPDTVSLKMSPGSPELMRMGIQFAEEITKATGRVVAVATGGSASSQGISLQLVPDDTLIGAEGYRLTVSKNLLTVTASKLSGIFYGCQTAGQLLSSAVNDEIPTDTLWGMPGVVIADFPRFAWRGAMLDVARHFFPVNDVRRFIDLMSLYKLNRLHLHLSDDQGWRVEIPSRPLLTAIGGRTQVGGSTGSFFYTQAEYREIILYAADRFITVVPEFDMPGHSTAALASYPELTCSGSSPPVYTGIEVGLPGVCVTKDTVYAFVNDVIRDMAGITPGQYFHIGGDESRESRDEYISFVNRVQSIVHSYGKTLIGWEEIGQASLHSSSVMQYWNNSVNRQAVENGVKVIVSPAKKIYLDMQYTSTTHIGQNWAGYVEVQKAYEWDPALELDGVTESDILGVEAPLWTEKIYSVADIEYMAFPRLIGMAEIGWSPSVGREWNEYKERLADHGKRLEMAGVNFYRSPQVPWK